MSIESSQEEMCASYGSPFVPPHEDETLGIALGTLGNLPLNALRHRPAHGTCGWYIWAGDLSQDPEFFQPVHVHHLVAHAPQIIPFLGLAPGWRVLLAPEQTEVWHDSGLLNV